MVSGMNKQKYTLKQVNMMATNVAMMQKLLDRTANEFPNSPKDSISPCAGEMEL